MLDIFYKFKEVLNPKERRNAMLLFCMILVTGIMEAVGVASIMPFLSVLANPQVIQENSILSNVYQSLGFATKDKFLVFLGIGVFIVMITSLSLKALTQYLIARFGHMLNYSLSLNLLMSYLSRPYSWFLNRHSADLSKTVLSEIQLVINQVFLPTGQFIANAVIAMCLITLLLMVNPWVALLSATLLGTLYATIYWCLRKYLNYIGSDRVKANEERFQIVQEALGGIKEVKAAGLEAGYILSFGKPAHRFARRQAVNEIIGKIPRYFFETITFGGMITITLVLLTINDGNLGQVLPTLGIFALAAQRLLPALNEVYANATKMRFGKPALNAFYADLMEKRLDQEALKRMQRSPNTKPLGLIESLDLVDIDFWYPKADRPALQKINFRIVANNTVGIVGQTGAGKTTVVDIILGLLSPSRGTLIVDKVAINKENISPWQRTFGYVPQQIFLADDTVSANIAFGVSKNKINQQAVERAARIAELHDFVVQELSKGYETTVGERGVRLSGGQRQRIGIARALYHDPDVLILDEATSALDNLTEKAVMQAVHNLNNKKTIILIAHRLSTVQNCDCIYMLDHGRLTAQGTYSELLKRSKEFQTMAGIKNE